MNMKMDEVRSAMHNKIDPARVLIMNTLPLTQARYEAGKRKGFSFFSQEKSDFLASQFPSDMIWETYGTILVAPILSEILKIRESSSVIIDYDVSFDDFKKAILSRDYDVIFLIAHHIEDGNMIEFAKSPVAFDKILNFLENEDLCKSCHFNFIICNGGEFIELKKKIDDFKGAVSAGFWNFPVLESYEFLRHWVLQLDGRRTLTEAYSTGIETYLNRITKL